MIPLWLFSLRSSLPRYANTLIIPERAQRHVAVLIGLGFHIAVGSREKPKDIPVVLSLRLALVIDVLTLLIDPTPINRTI